MAEFRCVGFQEFAPRRNGVEKIGDTESGASGQPRGLDADQFTVGKFDARAFGFRCVTRFEQQARYRGDGRKRFTAKTERSDGEEIVGGSELAGGVSFEPNVTPPASSD